MFYIAKFMYPLYKKNPACIYYHIIPDQGSWNEIHHDRQAYHVQYMNEWLFPPSVWRFTKQIKWSNWALWL
jgi:hypothetical protein